MASGDKPQSRPILLLKDYLRDDMGSCSSSGFKSFPRTQCCLHPRYSSSSSCSDAKSALQKASQAVLNVIKLLQIPPAPQRSPSSSLSQTRSRRGKKGVLSRSFSRRLLSRNFWRRASSSKGDGNNKSCTFVSTVSSASANCDDNTEWVDTSFTCSLTAAEASTDTEGSVTAVATTATDSCSVTNSTREWPNDENEQFSPVSVLDCSLFDDDEEDVMSPFTSTPCSCSLEGAKQQHMQISGDFNHVEKKMSSGSELNSNLLYCDNINSNNDDDVDNLMEKRHLCNVAEDDWIRRQHEEQVQHLSWESSYIVIKEMENCKMWSNNCDDDDEEIDCVAMELELEFFTRLVNDLLLDLTT